MPKHYHVLGKLPVEVIDFLRAELLVRKQPNVPYQWIHFNNELNAYFMRMFANTELKIQWSKDASRPIQKGFYSEPGHGFRIHKDGLQCKAALNISIVSNPTDWVRWYDEDYINSIGSMTPMVNSVGTSRNVEIMDYEAVPWIEEFRPQVGEVYVLNTDVYHSFKCGGPETRLIVQTKFDGFPNYETVKASLIKSSFSNLV